MEAAEEDDTKSPVTVSIRHEEDKLNDEAVKKLIVMIDWVEEEQWHYVAVIETARVVISLRG